MTPSTVPYKIMTSLTSFLYPQILKLCIKILLILPLKPKSLCDCTHAHTIIKQRGK